MTGQRCWWGWGYEDQHLAADELAGLGEELGRRLGTAPPRPRTPAAPTDVALGPPRVQAPRALAPIVDADPAARAGHAHGNAFRDVVRAFRGEVDAAPDLVARPREESEVAAVLDWCADAGLTVVPFGGGTSVVGGVNPPPDAGPVVTLDLTRLDRVVEVDPVSLAARIQAGALGPRIEEQLRPHGLTLRHFPQSWEFSSLGGWIATRAGGHYATRWTHIDDLTESVAALTPAGRWESRRLPGSGAGPSPDRLLLGSEGTLGVITEAWVRVQRRPTFRATATVAFPDFRTGSQALRALAQSGLDPANCRLLDPVEVVVSGAGDGSSALLLLGFESADHPLSPWIERALELCRDHGGSCPEGPRLVEGDTTGAAEGSGGSWRTAFLRAPYLRDALVSLGMVVETFETAVTWDRFDALVDAVHGAAADATSAACGTGIVSVRVTHAYPDGAAPYFTVIAPGTAGDEVRQWDEIKAAASEAILAAGGTITHHHAVGRDHAPWYARQRPAPFAEALRAAKDALDPTGMLNPGVLGL